MPKPRPPPPAAEAYALSLSSIAYAQLLNHMLDESRKSLDQCEEILAGVDDVEPVVNAGLYGVSADYYKVSRSRSTVELRVDEIRLGQGRLRGVLQGLVAVPRLHQPRRAAEGRSRQPRARFEHRSVAWRDNLQLWRIGTLILSHFGTTLIYGHLQLQHPLLNVLEDSPHKWLKDLLFVFNAGDIGQYEVLSQRLSEEVSTHSL
jgi:26S proteasome regulatory subunit N9